MNQLPVRVEDRLFAEMVKAPAGFTHAAYVDTMMVGGIASILEPVGGGAFNVVVQALAVLPAYRRNRIGNTLLTAVLEAAKARRCERALLHVHTANEDARAFYQTFGFGVIDTIRGCYKRISPPDAYLMALPLCPPLTPPPKRTPADAAGGTGEEGGEGEPASAAAGPPPRLSGRVSSDLDDLEALHGLYPWLPGRADIRPTPETLAAKRAKLGEVEARWVTFPDYIRVTVFGLPSCVDVASGRLASAGSDEDTIGKVVFAPNEFPYSVPRHWVLWYGAGFTGVTDEGVTAAIAARVACVPELAGKDFAWYVNPKMTVPEYMHVQVFLEP